MTKLTEWLAVGLTFAAIWVHLLLGYPIKLSESARFHVQLLPIYLVVLFGLVSAAIVLYRVATFNDCPEAYQELRGQIDQAKSDLKKKGIKFDE